MGNDINTRESLIKIKVIGAGGGGSNAVNRMITDEVENVDFIVVDTNAVSASKSKAPCIIQIGENEAQGIGAGASPEVGKRSAEENIDEIRSQLINTDLLFLTAGMGGGTGTGALPVIAEMAREMDILTIGIVKAIAPASPREQCIVFSLILNISFPPVLYYIFLFLPHLAL